MAKSRKKNVTYITKIFTPKYLLNCDRRLMVYTLNLFCVDYLERFISCVSIKIIFGNH